MSTMEGVEKYTNLEEPQRENVKRVGKNPSIAQQYVLQAVRVDETQRWSSPLLTKQQRSLPAMQHHQSLLTNKATSTGMDISFSTPIRNRITRVKTDPKDVTAEEVLTIVSSASKTFSSMDLWTNNNRF